MKFSLMLAIAAGLSAIASAAPTGDKQPASAEAQAQPPVGDINTQDATTENGDLTLQQMTDLLESLPIHPNLDALNSTIAVVGDTGDDVCQSCDAKYELCTKPCGDQPSAMCEEVCMFAVCLYGELGLCRLKCEYKSCTQYIPSPIKFFLNSTAAGEARDVERSVPNKGAGTVITERVDHEKE